MTRLQELIIDATISEPKNSKEFAIAQAKKHNEKVDEFAEKVYNAYLSKSTAIAIERKRIYQQNNYTTFKVFI